MTWRFHSFFDVKLDSQPYGDRGQEKAPCVCCPRLLRVISGDPGPLVVRDRSPPLELCLEAVVVGREGPRVLARRRTEALGGVEVLTDDMVNRLFVLTRCLVCPCGVVVVILGYSSLLLMLPSECDVGLRSIGKVVGKVDSLYARGWCAFGSLVGKAGGGKNRSNEVGFMFGSSV